MPSLYQELCFKTEAFQKLGLVRLTVKKISYCQIVMYDLESVAAL